MGSTFSTPLKKKGYTLLVDLSNKGRDTPVKMVMMVRGRLQTLS